MNLYSAYEYLSFILPGAVLLFASFFGYNGWHWKEPGGTALVGILAACYLVGQANAAIAQYGQPLLWGRRPSNKAQSDWGMFGPHGTFPTADRPDIEATLGRVYGHRPFQQTFAEALADMRRTGNDKFIDLLNAQIGLYRNLTSATLLSTIIVTYYNLSSRRNLPALPWIPIFVVVTILFANRYRHFWRRFGAHVVNMVRAVAATRPGELRRGADKHDTIEKGSDEISDETRERDDHDRDEDG